MLCPSGHLNSDGMIFCTQCGLRIAPNSNVAPNPSTQYSQSPNPFDTVGTPFPPAFVAQNSETQFPSKAKSNRNIATISVASTLLAVILIVLVFIYSSSESVPVTSETPEPTTKAVTVSLTVINGLDGCDLPYGYSDIPGAQFELRADGTVVGFGSYPYTGLDLTYGCKFSSTVFEVPDDADIYSVALASGNRGTIYNTRAELEANSWEFSLSLGND
jgi:hypothetical protein